MKLLTFILTLCSVYIFSQDNSTSQIVVPENLNKIKILPKQEVEDLLSNKQSIVISPSKILVHRPDNSIQYYMNVKKIDASQFKSLPFSKFKLLFPKLEK